MSVIATFSINQFPILLGDLLLSSDHNSETSLNLPTIGEITEIFPEGSGFIPIGLSQKVFVLNENLSLAWAGSKILAQGIIAELLRECQKKPFWESRDLEQFFRAFEAELDEVSILGYSNNGRGIFSFGFGRHESRDENENYGRLKLAGTGADDLKSHMNTFKPVLSGANPLENAVANTLWITSKMIGQERVSAQNLLNYYGGGFEIVSLVRKQFRKIDDFLCLIWRGFQMKDLSWRLALPEIAIKYFYIQDILLIKKIELKNQKNGSLKAVNKSIYLISPIIKNQAQDGLQLKNIKLSSFNSSVLSTLK